MCGKHAVAIKELVLKSQSKVVQSRYKKSEDPFQRMCDKHAEHIVNSIRKSQGKKK